MRRERINFGIYMTNLEIIQANRIPDKNPNQYEVELRFIFLTKKSKPISGIILDKEFYRRLDIGRADLEIESIV